MLYIWSMPESIWGPSPKKLTEFFKINPFLTMKTMGNIFSKDSILMKVTIAILMNITIAKNYKSIKMKKL